MESELQTGDALIVVDVQRDFCPGGALAIAEADAIVPVINRWIARALAAGVPIYLSRDWHPPHHVSFRESGGPWPEHCVRDTPGAAFHPDLDIPASAQIVSKGDRAERDQYSAFDGTGLAEELRRRGVRRVWIGGLALDVCVRATALDALQHGFAVRLIAAATRPVDAAAGRRTLDELRAAGATIETA